jgi:hypothetical protein
LAAHEQLDDVLHSKVERKVSNNLTLNYEWKRYLIEDSDFTSTLRGKHVVVVEAEDGTVRIKYSNRDLPATVFEKDAWGIFSSRFGRSSSMQAADSSPRAIAHFAKRNDWRNRLRFGGDAQDEPS